MLVRTLETHELACEELVNLCMDNVSCVRKFCYGYRKHTTIPTLQVTTHNLDMEIAKESNIQNLPEFITSWVEKVKHRYEVGNKHQAGERVLY